MLKIFIFFCGLISSQKGKFVGRYFFIVKVQKSKQQVCLNTLLRSHILNVRQFIFKMHNWTEKFIISNEYFGMKNFSRKKIQDALFVGRRTETDFGGNRFRSSVEILPLEFVSILNSSR